MFWITCRDAGSVDASTIANSDMLDARKNTSFGVRHKNTFFSANTDFADITEVRADHPLQHRSQPKSRSWFPEQAADEELKVAKISPDK